MSNSRVVLLAHSSLLLALASGASQAPEPSEATEPPSEALPSPGESAPSTEAPTMTSVPDKAHSSPSPHSTGPGLSRDFDLQGDDLWTALVGRQLRVEIKEADESLFLEGLLIAQTRDRLAIARSQDGLVVSVAKQAVQAVQVLDAVGGLSASSASKAQRELLAMPEGRGMLGTGIGLTVAATPVFITGIIFSTFADGFAFIFLGPAAATYAASIPLTVVGAQRRRAYQEKEREAFGLALAPTRGGAQAALSWRF